MIASVLGSISDFMYTYVLVALLIGVGLYFFVFTRALPLRMFGEALRVVMEPPKKEGGVSSFRALMVSTASRVGVGNIAGVATAVTARPPSSSRRSHRSTRSADPTTPTVARPTTSRRHSSRTGWPISSLSCSF